LELHNWATPTYQKRILSTLDTIADLHKIFGSQFAAPFQISDVGGNYNSNPVNGEVGGFIHFLDYTKGFTLSVCQTNTNINNNNKNNNCSNNY